MNSLLTDKHIYGSLKHFGAPVFGTAIFDATGITVLLFTSFGFLSMCEIYANLALASAIEQLIERPF